MERSQAASRSAAPGTHSAHPLPARSRCLSGRTGTKGLPANFAGLEFFKSLLRCLIPLGMIRTRLHASQFELAQPLADRAFGDRYRKTPGHLCAQVNTAP